MLHPTGQATSKREIARGMRAATALVGLLVLAAAGLLFGSLPRPTASAFVGGVPAAQALPRLSRAAPLRAEAQDAEVIGEEPEEVEEEEEELVAASGDYPAEAYAEYGASQTPDIAWFDRNKIDRHKVNMLFFDMYKKPKNFFPHELQAGDTVRVYYMEPQPQGDKEVGDYKSFNPKAMKEIYFDGVILNFKGAYHARVMTVRAMVGKGENVMGFEMKFPMHSPLVTKIEVLRRGYIGTNKNAYWMRAMVGKRNAIPLDKERTEMDQRFEALVDEGREAEIPESSYPQQEWDRYPLPVWKQDEDDWDEEKYAPELVDQRSEYERRVIANYRLRVKRKGGRFGFKR